MRELVKNTSIMGFTKLLLVVVGIVRNKYLAVTIGPQGFGIYSLLMYFFHLGDVLAGTSLGGATLKYMAEYNSTGEHEKVEVVFNIAYFIVFILVSLLTVIFNVFYFKIKTIFLSQEVIYIHYLLFSLSYFFGILGGVFEAGVKGLIKIKDLAIRSIVASVASIIFTIVCVGMFGLTGFFLSLLLTSILSTLVLYLSLRRSINIVLRVPDLKNDLFRKVLKFSFIDMFSNISMVVGDYMKRKFVVSALSISSLGIYSAATSFSNHLSIVSGSAQSYMFPKLSERITIQQRDKLFSDYTKLVSIFLGVCCSIIVLFGTTLINLLYSSEFRPIADILYLFMFGIIIQSVQVSYLWSVYGMAKLKIFTYVTVLTDILSILLSWVFIRRYGLIVLPITGIICSTLRILVWSVFLRRELGIWLALRSYRYTLVALSATYIASTLITASLITKLAFILAVVSVFFVITPKSDVTLIKSYVGENLANIRNRIWRDKK